MTDLPNGFTGFSHRDPNFVSAGDALRGSRYDDTPFAARKQAQARNLAEAWSPAGAERVGAGVAVSQEYVHVPAAHVRGQFPANGFF